MYPELSYNFEPSIAERLRQSHLNNGSVFTVAGAGRKRMNARQIMREHRDIMSRIREIQGRLRKNEK
jgi:hypothetical protein